MGDSKWELVFGAVSIIVSIAWTVFVVWAIFSLVRSIT